VSRWCEAESAAAAEFPSAVPLREPARVWASWQFAAVGGSVSGPVCCGERMDDDGGCREGCCDDYRCARCGQSFRVEWPD
jgi:hypothetical protein